MEFKNWIENHELRTSEWQTLQGTGYSVGLTQYSNKGPMFVVKDYQGQEIGRTYFDIATMKWKNS